MMMVTTTTMMMKIPKLVAISTKMIRRMMITYIFTSENSLHDFMKAESNNEYKIPSSFQTFKEMYSLVSHQNKPKTDKSNFF